MENIQDWTDEDRKKMNRMMFLGLCFIGIYITCLLSCLTKKITSKEYFDLGKHYMAEGEYVKAEQNFTHAIAQDKKYVEAYYERAKANQQMDSISKCIVDYTFILDSTQLTVQAKGNVLLLRAEMYRLNLQDSLKCSDYKAACELANNHACDLYRKVCK